jgi:hypothetical protein
MAVDRIETTWHLTPDGWVEGSCDSMWSDYIRTVEPPANRAETWIHKLYQASAYSPESNSFYRTWVSPAVSEKQRKALHEKSPSSMVAGVGFEPTTFGL